MIFSFGKTKLPLYTVVRIKRVSVERGSTVLTALKTLKTAERKKF